MRSSSGRSFGPAEEAALLLDPEFRCWLKSRGTSGTRGRDFGSLSKHKAIMAPDLGVTSEEVDPLPQCFGGLIRVKRFVYTGV